MSMIQSFIGIDIGAKHFAASLFLSPQQAIVTQDKIPNDHDGFYQLLQWLKLHHCRAETSVLCMEATGIYGERLAYFLSSQGFSVAIEPPLRVI